MHYLILAFIAIFIIFHLIAALINALSFIGLLARATIPAWGVGIVVGVSVFIGLRHYFLNSLRSQEKLANLVMLSFDGKKLNCSIQDAEVREYATTISRITFSLALLSCISVTLFVLLSLFNSTDAFRGRKYIAISKEQSQEISVDLSAQTVFRLACLTSFIPIGLTFVGLISTQSFKRSAREEVDRLVASANLSLKPANELQSLINQIASLSARAKVQFPESSTLAVRSYVESNKANLLISTAGLDRLLEAELARARDDRNKLEKAVKLDEVAMSIYTDTARHVNRTGSMTLIKDMEYIYTGLTHYDLKSLLPQRKWNEFHDIVNLIIKDLQGLKDSAVKYELHEEAYEEVGEKPSVEAAKVEEAYRLLGVQPTMTDEEIKEVVIKLNKAFHPDRFPEKDRDFFDEKLRYINGAHLTIKSARDKS